VPLLVDLADEFRLTTSEALELCAALGIDADGLGSVLSEAEARHLRDAVAHGAVARLGPQPDLRPPPPPAPAPLSPSGSGGPGSLADRLGGVHPAPEHDGSPVPQRPAWGGGAPPVPRPAAARATRSLGSRVQGSLPAWLTGNLPAVALCTLAGVGLVAYILSSGGEDSTAGPGDGMAYATALLTDDCFDLPDGDDVRDVDLVAERPCSEAHDVEVIAEVRTYQGRFMDEIDAYPGRAALEADAITECLGRFERVVGKPYRTSGLELLAIVPTEVTFADLDERVSLCGVVSPSGDALDGRAAVVAEGEPTATSGS
jgi:hypothetical protein